MLVWNTRWKKYPHYFFQLYCTLIVFMKWDQMIKWRFSELLRVGGGACLDLPVWDPMPPPKQWGKGFLSMILAANNFWEALWIDVLYTGVIDESYTVLPFEKPRMKKVYKAIAVPVNWLLLLRLWSLQLLHYHIVIHWSPVSCILLNLYQVTVSSP